MVLDMKARATGLVARLGVCFLFARQMARGALSRDW